MALPTIALNAGDGKIIRLPTGLFIDNRFVPSVRGETLDVKNAASRKSLGPISAAAKKDVDVAVASSLKTYERTWRHVAAAGRRQLMLKLADLIERDLDDFAAIESIDVGQLYGTTKGMLGPMSVEWIRYFAGFADKMEGRSANWDDAGAPSGLSYTRREPYGVTAAIVPWNTPLMLTCWKIAPSIAAGNTLVIKPPELAPLSALKLAQLIVEAGFPPGVINIIPGLGSTAGSALAHHMDVRKIAFTGSTATGRMILEASARSNLKKVSLELGGKSPVIVFDDADFDQAVAGAAAGITAGEGQICAAGSRIYVQDTIYQKFLTAFSEKCKDAAFGNPLAADTAKGPLISDDQREKVLGFIHRAQAKGIPLLHGGNRVRDSNGVENTAFYDVPADAEVIEQEIFGPVAAISKFSTEDDVIQRSNDSNYGLSASVFTTNLCRAHRIAARLGSGQVTVNGWGMLAPNMPFGGFKQSGFGRDGGAEALDDWTVVKAVKLVVPKL
ncbi:aldehyde dehydrogenase [Hortaea werneckii]|nr:aldehyde dehydrogenase [Hortaea werneckii]